MPKPKQERHAERWIFGRRPGDAPPPRPRRAEPKVLQERDLKARRELVVLETRRHHLQTLRLEALALWLAGPLVPPVIEDLSPCLACGAISAREARDATWRFCGPCRGGRR